MVRFLESWLEDRTSTVLVSGASTVETSLSDSVFQGTVLGPPLWNLFYADAIRSILPTGFTEFIFADDFNCWKGFCAGSWLEDLVRACADCQASLHSWGEANSVRFDPEKKSFHILHRTHGLGDGFTLLGLHFDESLRMVAAISDIAREAGWRLQSILRPRRFFSRRQLMNLYKSQVLSFVESGTPGYYHAAPSVIASLDRVQRRFLREVGLDESEALVAFHLAPLQSRRDIAMLGLLHRIVLGIAPTQLQTLFPFAPLRDPLRVPTRLSVQRHERQFIEPLYHTDVLGRSIFGLTKVYNLLPSRVVQMRTVKAFQSALQKGLRRTSASRFANWQLIYSPPIPSVHALQFQALFE